MQVASLQFKVEFASIGPGVLGLGFVVWSAVRDGESATEEIAVLDWQGPSVAQCDTLVAVVFVLCCCFGPTGQSRAARHVVVCRVLVEPRSSC